MPASLTFYLTCFIFFTMQRIGIRSIPVTLGDVARRGLATSLAWALLAVWPAGGGVRFILIGDDNRAFGPYEAADTAIPILDGDFTLVVRSGSATLRSPGDPEFAQAPFFFTNQAVFTAGALAYRVMLTSTDFDAAFQAGRQTGHMQRQMEKAEAMEHAGDGLALLKAAAATNSLFLNRQAVSNVIERLEKRAAEENAMRAAGKAIFEGRWLPAAEVERLRLGREEQEMRAKGLQKVGDEWLTIDAARERRLEIAREAARAEGERLRQRELNQCRRCNGSGAIYFELRPMATAADSRIRDQPQRYMRIERPGVPPKDIKIETERNACPDCRGTGQRQRGG